MAIKSEAQRKRLEQLAKEGKLKPETLDKMIEDAGNEALPDRVTWPKVTRAQRVGILRPLKPMKGR